MPKKLIQLKPQGTLNFHSFLGDWQGCGTIRIIFPSLLFNQYRYKKMTVSCTYNSFFINDLNFYKTQTFIKFQRAATEQHLQLFSYFKGNILKQLQRKLPILYESDDLLSPDIPETNYAHPYYKKNWKNIMSMLNIADGVTVSTKPLKDYYSKYNSNISIVPNHLPRFLWGMNSNFDGNVQFVSKDNSKPRILWAGSQNHFNPKGSGGDFGSELIKFILDTQDKYEWVFVGAIPFELKNKGFEFHNWQTIFDLPVYLNNLNIDLGIAPLENNIFNDCKSNLKMLEFTALGIPGIYSNSYPYKDATLKADTEEYMVDQIKELVSSPEKRGEVFEKDHKILREQLWLEDNLKNWINQHLKLFGKKL